MPVPDLTDALQKLVERLPREVEVVIGEKKNRWDSILMTLEQDAYQAHKGVDITGLYFWIYVPPRYS